VPHPAPANDKPANDNEPMTAFLLGMRGQVAALAGLPLGANPYAPDTTQGLRWLAAWAGARAELFETGVFGRADRDMA
jgi:hypothetical protein